jgi:hypothetical protein
MTLALEAAQAEGGHERVALRILHDEKNWVKYRFLPHGQGGRHFKIWTMLDDPGTLAFIHEKRALLGESKCYDPDVSCKQSILIGCRPQCAPFNCLFTRVLAHSAPGIPR